MLELFVQGDECYDDEHGRFTRTPSTVLRLEHSLRSLSKWESKYERAFLGDEERTIPETKAYVRMMCVDGEIPPEVFSRLTNSHFDEINKYISAKMTATTVRDRPGSRPSREKITSELIYYWMLSHNIPFECQDWHLSRLLMLIRVCAAKNQPQKKAGKPDLAARRNLNAQRQAKLGTSG